MRFISTKIHGMLDYVIGFLLIASPWIFGLAGGSAEMWVLIASGLFVLGQTIFTDFELGLVPKISVITHLRIDLMLGLFLIVSPWLFNFVVNGWVLQVTFGIFVILASLITRKISIYRQHSNLPF